MTIEMGVCLVIAFTLVNLGICMINLKLYTEFAKERFKGGK